MPEALVDGWTEPILQQLLNDGVAFDATGITLALDLRDRQGSAIPTSGKVTWGTASTSIAKFSPASSDLKAAGSPYHARWKITASGKDAFYPNGEADIWTVRK